MASLYIISPPEINLPTFADKLKKAFDENDVAMFQLRLKNIPDNDILLAAEKLVPVCNDYGVSFIMNDSAELAVKCGADGVHIGDEDGGFEKARSLLGNKIIGVSCYNSLERAIEMADKGASYVSFGAFFPTKTKIAKSKAEIETLIKFKQLRQWK